MSEFQSDHFRSAHLDALRREKEGYEARVRVYERDEDDKGVRKMRARVAEVDAEITRIEGGDSTPEEKPRRRGSSADTTKDEPAAA